MGGRSATYVVASSARPLGGHRLALVDNLAGARAAGCPRINITATGCPGTVRLRGTSSPWKVGHASRETHKCHARDADAGWQSDPEAWGNPNADGTATA